MKQKTHLFFLVIFLFALGVSAQQPEGPTAIGTLQGPAYVPSIAEQLQNGTFIPADDDPSDMGHPKRKHANRTVPGKGLPLEGAVDPLVELQINTTLQRRQPALQTFETTTSTATPSDPTGAVGPNHYVAAWNTSFRIFDKSGNALSPAASLSTLFPGNSIGDPIVFYDQAADRFIITEFDNSPNGFNVAVSQGSDPVNDGWYVYTTGFETGSFPDYTKFSVWADTYMVTANIGTTNKIFAIERNEMLNGNSSQFVALSLPGIVTSGFFSTQAFHTAGSTLAPALTPAPIVYFQDDAWSGVSTDHLKVWGATIDWNTPSNSSVSAAQEISTTAFTSVFDGGSFSNLSQPSGPDIDALQATVMNQAQYRRFSTHNSAVFNFVVDTDSGSEELAGVRWYELRQDSDGDPWSIYQEGTYVSPDGGKHAFAASMAMNSVGDIGMGYSTVSSTEMIAIYYTGRLSTDPLNVMTTAEGLIAQSTANNTNLRYADYTQLSVDPNDDSFWHVSEYFNTGRRDIVGQFVLDSPVTDDIGVVSIDAPVDGVLTASESITITIGNFGSNNITNPEVQYTIDGGAAVVENYSGTISAGEEVGYTFSQTADLSATGSYVIVAKTNLSGDSNTSNDSATKTVTNNPVVYCTPSMNCSYGDGFQLVSVQEINNVSGCEGYGDFTSLVANLNQDTTYDLTLTTGYGNQNVKVWIDFDDDGTFDNDELVISNFVIARGRRGGSYTVTVDLAIPSAAATGAHRMRVKSNWRASVPTDACEETTYGETEDYTVNISSSLRSVELVNSELIVVSGPNNQFEISLITPFEDIASIAVYNTLGQTVAFNNLTKEGDRYRYSLDMSYASAGVYIIKVGDQRSDAYKTARIIVK